jgi:hypothetical protein
MARKHQTPEENFAKFHQVDALVLLTLPENKQAIVSPVVA